MKKLFTLVIFVAGFLSATYAIGQVYNGKAGAIKEPMDKAIEHQKIEIGNVAIAGAAEDARTQEERYETMVAPGNAVNEHHFDALGTNNK